MSMLLAEHPPPSASVPDVCRCIISAQPSAEGIAHGRLSKGPFRSLLQELRTTRRSDHLFFWLYSCCELCAQVRITTPGKTRNYISYATTLLTVRSRP